MTDFAVCSVRILFLERVAPYQGCNPQKKEFEKEVLI
jgi:hypothetical protein